MTERQWLTSTDPRDMLWFLLPTRSGDMSPLQCEMGIAVSDRKLRQLAQAIGGEHAISGNWIEAQYPDDPTLWLDGWFRGMRGQPGEAAEFARAAALLRCLFGNPWRPVTTGLDEWPSHHSNQTVLALARAACDERKCERCCGIGRLDLEETEPCPVCHGTGRIGSGLLDNDRLAVLADALEEAGCTDPDILGHLRGTERCVACRGTGGTWEPLCCVPCGGIGRVPAGPVCPGCKGEGTVRVCQGHGDYDNVLCPQCNPSNEERICGVPGSHPGYLPALHGRGCWVLDLLLGKE